MRRNLAQDRYPWQRMQGDNKKTPGAKKLHPGVFKFANARVLESDELIQTTFQF